MHSNEEGKWVGDEADGALCDASRTTGVTAVEALPDADLLAGTRRLVCLSNRDLAALLAHLAEVEARGLHRTRACASLYSYCIYELRMSEDAAYRRVGAARLVKRFPLLLGAIERGELHLTGLLQLGPHLTHANLVEVLARAQFRTKKEIEKLVRLLSPLPDVPSRIEPLGLEQPRQRATWGNLLAGRHPVRELPPEERPDNWLPAPASDSSAAPALATPARSDGHGSDGVEAGSLNDAPARIHATIGSSAVALERTNATSELSTAAPARTPAMIESPTAAPARIEDGAMSLSGPQRYKVQFTASEEYVALVEEAKALLAHASPDADIAEIHLRAVKMLVAELKKRKYAYAERRVATASPSAKMPDNTRSVPSADAPPRAPRQRDTSEPRQRDAAPPAHQQSRHVPAAVRRQVFERDGQRCAYVDARGVRCRETRRLEIHHHEPFAHGGPMTLDNLSVHCVAHNALAAERDFGRESSREKRESQTYFAERTLANRVPIG